MVTSCAVTPAVRVVAGLAAARLLASCGDGGAASEAPPTERIIPVNGDLAEVVYARGLGDQVVATDISATYPPEADATPKIGTSSTLVAETILSFDPTIVLADDLAEPSEVLEQLDDGGVEVVRIDRQTTLDAPAAKIRAVAGALGVTERGEQLVAALESELASAAERAEAVAAAGRPKVLALYLRGESVQLAFGAGSAIDAVIDAAGGTDLGTAMSPTTPSCRRSPSPPRRPTSCFVTTSGPFVGGVDGLVAIPGIDQTPAGQQRRVVVLEDQYLYGLGPRTGQLVGEPRRRLPYPVTGDRRCAC